MIISKNVFVEDAQQLSGLSYRSLDMKVVRRNIIERINVKANLVLNDYRREAANKLSDLIVVTDVLLVGYDLENIAGNMSNRAKKVFDKILFATPEHIYIYDGYNFITSFRSDNAT